MTEEPSKVIPFPSKEAAPAGAPLLTVEEALELKKRLDEQAVPESAVTAQTEMPTPPAPTEAERAEKQQLLDATHAQMWANLDGKSPFEWPDDARNLFQSGCACSLWGRSVVDMTPDQRILFVAYVDAIASDLYAQCKGLAMAMEQMPHAKPPETGESVVHGVGE